jgi:predicted nucleic acid-binding protein
LVRPQGHPKDPTEEIEELIVLIEERSENVFVTGSVNLCRDMDDNMIIETALKGQARFIVSRDDDIKFDSNVSSFLNLHNVAVKTIADFLEILKTK